MTNVRQVEPRPGVDVDDDVDVDIAPGAGPGKLTSSHGVEGPALQSPQRHVPGPDEVASAPSPNRQADKITSLLASYYDVDDVDDDLEVEEIQPAEAAEGTDVGRVGRGVETGPSSASPAAPSPSHNGEILSHIKSNQRLDDLLTTERELATDVGNADIELRGVVYDSYCAFIKASETVHGLHTALHDVDASLHHLDTLLSSVAENSDTIDHRLNAQQRVIFQLHEKRTVAQGLEELLKVGERMREELDVGDYEQVVRLYRGSVDALEAFRQHEAVERARVRVAEIRRQAVDLLRERLNGDRSDMSDMSDMSDRKEKSTIRNDQKILGMLIGLGEAREDLLEAYLGRVQGDIMAMRPSTPDASVWAIVAETMAVCEEILSSPPRAEDTEDDGGGGDGGSSVDAACTGILDAFIANFVGDIAADMVNRQMEAVLAALAGAGGFDVSGAEHADSDQHQQREAYAAALPGMFEGTFDALLRQAREIDGQRANSGHGLAASIALRAISEALAQHVLASYAVVMARAFKAIKEMMMRLLLTDDEDVRFLRVLIKSLEVNAKQDFGLVEKTVEAWVGWDGCVTNLQVLDSIDSSCQEMLSALCHGVRRMVAGDAAEEGPAALARLPPFLQKQFTVPATLALMDRGHPVALLCLASSLTAVRSAVVDAEMKDAEVAATANGLTARYQETMASEIKTSVTSTFASEVLGQVTTPSKPSQTALDIIRLVGQVKTDCTNTNRPETTWPKDMLNIALAEEMHVTERSKPISKAAFQQLQVDLAVLKRRLGAEIFLDGDLDGIVSRAAESCREPALVDPLTLERVAGIPPEATVAPRQTRSP